MILQNSIILLINFLQKMNPTEFMNIILPFILLNLYFLLMHLIINECIIKNPRYFIYEAFNKIMIRVPFL